MTQLPQILRHIVERTVRRVGRQVDEKVAAGPLRPPDELDGRVKVNVRAIPLGFDEAIVVLYDGVEIGSTGVKVKWS